MNGRLAELVDRVGRIPPASIDQAESDPHDAACIPSPVESEQIIGQLLQSRKDRTLQTSPWRNISQRSVFKYIPNYYPKDVGAVDGLVGMLGALGGFFLPKVFGWLGRESGFPQAAFLALLVLTVASLAFLQLAICAFRARESTAGCLAPSPVVVSPTTVMPS